ncbi:SDR family NAD(P)-dependent oxidoreductase [Actinomadura rubrisoli]|uniref:SDR family oxidoreductase n=1 Tax=Actinomadura rubrisoli TaxID=2530368 RepID=A0A4R5BNN2_9ACTN|nr:SDR family oxidoreductase [Actinomadura rubrisoli]TDD86973.1 SDR family oxidoreductase [Actinomadura rubrisoli]
MTARFDGKVVLITGGGGTIARATALAFAREGATVVLAGRDAAALDGAAKEIEAAAASGRVDHVVADVTVPSDAARMVGTVAERHGGLHVAFNNAGIFGAVAPVADLPDDVWADVLNVNLTGVFLSMKHEIAHMREHGGGAIVNAASNIGAHGRRPGMSAYAASKAGVSVLTRTAARDHIADGVRINAISPGASDTPMSFRPGESRADRDARLRTAVPAGRASDPAEVAEAVLWLASDESSFVVGHDMVIDGGTTA